MVHFAIYYHNCTHLTVHVYDTVQVLFCLIFSFLPYIELFIGQIAQAILGKTKPLDLLFYHIVIVSG